MTTYDRVFQWVTLLALAVLAGLGLAMLWGRLDLVAAGKVAVTVLIVWLLLVVAAAWQWQDRGGEGQGGRLEE